MIDHLHALDVAILGAFLIFQTWIGFRLLRRRGVRNDAAEFLLGGRQLTLPAFVMTLVSTWYGGILGVGEYSYQYGVSNWLVFGVPYYLWAVVFALFLARRARRTLFFSIPDHLQNAYGNGPAIAGGIIVFVMTVPAAYVLMLGTLGKLLLGWPLWAGIVLGTAVSIAYVFLGGFQSLLRTDKIQFIAMFAGFAVIIPLCFVDFGGWTFLKGNLPATHLTWHGGNSGWYILSWYFIAAATLVEPAFYQRCYAAKSESVAKRGIFVSVLFWIVFDFMTTTAGLYARAALPGLTDGQESFPALAARILPPGLMGIFLIGMLATVISTVDSYMFLSAISLGRDVICRLRTATDRLVNIATRWALLASAVLAVTLALMSQSVIGLWRDLGSIGVPALLLPVLGTFRQSQTRVPPGRVVAWMLVPAVVAAFWIGLRAAMGAYPWGVEPIFPGLATSAVIASVNLLWPQTPKTPSRQVQR
ncbi:MAG: sodium:solute symporter family protein [Candidatus Zixiibacteriota bacterium]